MRVRSLFLLLSLSFVVAGNVYSQTAGWKTYADKKNGFSISYPPDFKLSVGDKAASVNYFGDPGEGTKMIKVAPLHIPEKYHGDYEFNIWLSTDPKDKCGAPETDEFQGDDAEAAAKRPKTKSIDGHPFFTYADSDSGMSKSMILDGYRAAVNDRCWQIQRISNQAFAFDHTTTFNFKIIDALFEKFVNSFRLEKGK